MKFSMRTQLFVLASIVIGGSDVSQAFQVDTHAQKQYRDVIETTTQQKVKELPPIKVIDDDGYCPPDEDYYDYWYDNRIHVFGNTGFLGGLHAFVAPFATKAIDDAAYEGEDIRTRVSKYLSEEVGKAKDRGARICDLCSGVGISTRALQTAFPDAEAIVGIDTSKEMISMAKFLTNHIGGVKDVVRIFSTLRDDARSFLAAFVDRSKLVRNRLGWSNRPVYAQGNAEHTVFHDDTFDLVTIM